MNTFAFKPAIGVKIPKGPNKSNFRPLVVANVESRIVQRAIHDVLCTHPKIKEYTHTHHSFGGVKLLADDGLSEVPAAIQAVLDAISNGARYIMRSDIAQFFTRIQKPAVTKIVAEAVSEPAFVELFSKAIAVELENMAQLREAAHAFPIEDIGVAQGNSLSPLLGNIFLHDFDAILNSRAGVRCIRYIDDFIILAPTRDSAHGLLPLAEGVLRDGDSAPIRTRFRGESEQHSGLKANSIPEGSRTWIPV